MSRCLRYLPLCISLSHSFLIFSFCAEPPPSVTLLAFLLLKRLYYNVKHVLEGLDYLKVRKTSDRNGFFFCICSLFCLCNHFI